MEATRPSSWSPAGRNRRTIDFLIGIVLVSLACMSVSYKVGKDSIRNEAVANGCARWVGDKDGSPVFAWGSTREVVNDRDVNVDDPDVESALTKALVSYYCATGSGCDTPICGGNAKTANGRDASVGDGCAVDPKVIPYGSTIELDGRSYIADDTFGRKTIEKDRNEGITHIDIRVSGKEHDDVYRMGFGFRNVRISTPEKE